jgi:hypothetical protein
MRVACLVFAGFALSASINMQWPAEEDVLKGLLAVQRHYTATSIQANP